MSGGARRHFRYIQQVLHKCLSPSPAERKAGWEWAETPEGRLEGGGRGRRGSLRVEAKARLLVAAPPPPTPGPSQPSPQLPRQSQGPVRTRARCLGPGTTWREGEGLPSPVCRVWGDAGHRLISVSRPPSLSVSPHLPASEMETSPRLTLCFSAYLGPAVPLALPSLSLWPPSRSLGL